MCLKKRYLAVQEGFGAVVQCDCGTIHITAGSVSVVVDQDALRRVRDLAEEALQRLAETPEGVAGTNSIHSRRPRLH
jgi:hypothetical protein